jgi:hypothetical protein
VIARCDGRGAVTVRFGVSYGTVPYSIALHTCNNCGESAVETDLAKSAPEDWLCKGADVHLCPHCAGGHPKTSQPKQPEECSP